MFQKICPHFGISRDVAPDQILARFGFQPRRSCRDQTFNVELVGINQKTHERFLVVRLIGNVREDEQARFFLRARRTDKRNHQGENGKRFDHKIYFDGISVLKV